MQRSGTSCISSLLEANGLHFSDDLVGPNPINLEGAWESTEVVAINDRLLHMYRCNFSDPSGVVTRFSRSLLRRAERYLLRLATRPVVGWKDPRMTITWPAWHELLYKNRHIAVACFRHPRNVARSCIACDGNLGYELTLECWRKLNCALASITSEMLFINFDEPLEPQIQYACNRLGLQFRKESMSSYKPKLVHNNERELGSGSDEVDSLYEHLLTRWRSQRMDPVLEQVAAL
jgi:hypothetical protein